MGAPYKDLSAEEVRQRFAYDPSTGDLIHRLKSRNGRQPGDLATFVNGYGYLAVAVGCRSYRAHRIAWLIHYGCWPSGEIDHLDGDRQNNRLDNLRDVPKSINGHNRPARRDSRSGIKGVRERAPGRWAAEICVAGRRMRLGSFPTKEAAADAYRQAAKAHLPDCPRAA